jgi:hypothetical protein
LILEMDQFSICGRNNNTLELNGPGIPLGR